ncbi:MAG: ComF family protein [Chitinophagales bacterium]
MMTKDEQTICSICEIQLPYAEFYKVKDNPLEKRFWGRVEIQRAGALLFFEKGSKIQHLIQLLKYQGREDVGEKIAELFARKLPEDSPFRKVDIIIPIPLHHKKKKIRGYNQCDTFTKVLGEKLAIKTSFEVLERIHANVTQTGKSKIDRWENVAQIFKVVKPDLLKNKHILLVDDVVTTGATLEACALEILKIENTKVSILTMACAI